MNNIITIGYEIPGHTEYYHDISSNVSMLDADIIVFCPQMLCEYFMDGFHEGKRKLDKLSSRRIMEDCKHWRRETVEALKAGKTIFVFLTKKEEYFISFSGINYDLFDNYRWLPLDDFQIINVRGEKIKKPQGLEFLSYYDAFEDELVYDVVIESGEIEPIFNTSSGTRVVGGKLITETGNLIFIPYPKHDEKDDFVKKGEDGEEYWTRKAVTWGNKLLSSLVNIHKTLFLKTGKTPPPNWITLKTYSLKNEISLKAKINSIEKRIEKLTKENESHSSDLQKEIQIKDLLYEQGKPLESAVIKALEILGYNAEGYNDGTLELDQVIVSAEGERFIGECEGKDNSLIDINKFRQLADAIHEDFEREEVSEEAIGLLFGNPYRLTKPTERKEFFTRKCIQGATRRKYGLIKTIDLFSICKYLMENDNEDYKKECRDAIVKGLGKIIKFPKIPKAE